MTDVFDPHSLPKRQLARCQHSSILVAVLIYKVALLVLLAVAGAISAATAYYYQTDRGQISDLNNKVSNLVSQVDSLQNRLQWYESNVVNTTRLSGTVQITPQRTGRAVAIVFGSGNSTYSSPSSNVSAWVSADMGYWLYLPNGHMFKVVIFYVVTCQTTWCPDSINGEYSCVATTSPYVVPQGPPQLDVRQDFLC